MPHFTYHVADDYDFDRLAEVLRAAGAAHGPFRAHAGGIGLFTGKKLVVHIPLVRCSALNRFQRAIWHGLEGTGTGVVQHFHPELWIPHVTLAYHGLTAEILPHLVQWMAARSFAWDFHVDHVQVIKDQGLDQALVHHTLLAGAASAG